MSNEDTSLSGLSRCAIRYGFMIVFSVIESSLNLAKNMSNHKILLHSRLTVPNVPSSKLYDGRVFFKACLLNICIKSKKKKSASCRLFWTSERWE